jgi:hypothetical protein
MGSAWWCADCRQKSAPEEALQVLEVTGPA